MQRQGTVRFAYSLFPFITLIATGFMSGVFDYAGPNRNSRYRSRSCCLPRMLTASASGLYVFAAQCPTPPTLYLRFAAYLAIGLAARLEAKWIATPSL